MLKNISQTPSSPKSERGQSMVELAISLIVILTLLAGAVDFGIALYSYVALRDAVQEGALYASFESGDGTNLDCAAIEDRVRSASSNPVDLTDTTKVSISICTVPAGSSSYVCPSSCSVSGASPCEGYGAGIQVNATYDYDLSMPFLSGILGTNVIPITASVTDTILSPACP